MARRKQSTVERGHVQVADATSRVGKTRDRLKAFPESRRRLRGPFSRARQLSRRRDKCRSRPAPARVLPQTAGTGFDRSASGPDQTQQSRRSVGAHPASTQWSTPATRTRRHQPGSAHPRGMSVRLGDPGAQRVGSGGRQPFGVGQHPQRRDAVGACGQPLEIKLDRRASPGPSAVNDPQRSAVADQGPRAIGGQASAQGVTPHRRRWNSPRHDDQKSVFARQIRDHPRSNGVVAGLW